MSKTFIKNDLIFFCSHCEFPKDLIFPEALFHKDILFSNNIQQPEFINLNKKNKLSNSFLIEEEIEGKKGGFKKGKFPGNFNNITKGNNYNQQVTWKKNEFEDPGFFDNFKGKTDERKGNTFKKNIELFEIKENSLCITDNIIIDYIKRESETHLQSENFTLSKIDLNKDYSKKENITIISEDDLFNSNSIYSINKKNYSEGKKI
jgi:hypothetical protein